MQKITYDMAQQEIAKNSALAGILSTSDNSQKSTGWFS